MGRSLSGCIVVDLEPIEGRLSVEPGVDVDLVSLGRAGSDAGDDLVRVSSLYGAVNMPVLVVNILVPVEIPAEMTPVNGSQR